MAPSKSLVALFLALAVVANTLQPSQAIRVPVVAVDQEAQEKTAAAASMSTDALVAKPSAPSAGLPSTQVTDCLPPLMRLMPCLDYLTDNSVRAPPSTCCNGFKSLINDAPICLCHGLNGNINKIMPAPMDFRRMMSLPGTCRVALPLQTLAKCAVGPVPPLTIPAPAPSPVTAPSPAPSP